MKMTDLTVDPKRACLLVVDIQERLAAAMPETDRATCVDKTILLIELAKRLEIPVVISEQYPKGLGPTVPAIIKAIEGAFSRRFEKLEFGCPAAPAFDPIWRELGRDQWIVCGMETHVCVYQTARGLALMGATVHVPHDGVVSRSPENRRVGLALIERTGGIVTCAETVVFDALHRAGTEDFKAMSRLVR